MKKLKILVIDEKDFIKVGEEIEEILKALKVEYEVCLVTTYEAAKKIVRKERFDIISLCDLLDVTSSEEARRFVTTISALNPRAVTFFLFDEPNFPSSKFARDNGIDLVFSKGKNFGLSSRMIFPADSIVIRKAIIETGVVSSLVSALDLTETIRIFSYAYTKLRPSEKIAQDACDCVAVRLNAKEIKYAILDYDSRVDIVVEVDKKAEVIEIALKSNLKFWHDYVVKNWIQP